MPSKPILVASQNPPTIEIDREYTAAYVRFSKRKVSKTQSIESKKGFVNVDLDASGRVVGIELIGIPDFQIAKVLDEAKIDPGNVDFSKSKFRLSEPVCA